MTETKVQNPRFEDKGNCRYDLDNLPGNVLNINPTLENIDRYQAVKESGEKILWGNETYVPIIGDTVKIKFNDLGTGLVESYFVEHGWLGVCVKLDKVPEWKRKQQKDDPRRAEVALVFGAEIEKVKSILDD